MFLSSGISQTNQRQLTRLIISGNPTHAQLGDPCSSGKLYFKTKQTNTHTNEQRKLSNHGILQNTLGCMKLSADSQISSDREMPCSHKTQGPPLASLLSSQSPSSPRRHSSEGKGGEEERGKAEKRRLWRGRSSLYYRNQLTMWAFLTDFTFLLPVANKRTVWWGNILKWRW